MDESESELTTLLQRWHGGDSAAFEQLLPLVFSQLHAIARGYMRRERGDHTLQPTALVGELYMRLVGQQKVQWSDRTHFFIFAARVMRNILKDHARAHLAQSRGGDFVKVPLSEEVAWIGTSADNVLDLSKVLEELEAVDARKAQLVELRFFLGLTLEEAADVLGISIATAKRDLNFARSWLLRALQS